MTTPICMYCECFITGKAHKDYAYAPLEIRYYCEPCVAGEK
jgi:hypothetical protein